MDKLQALREQLAALYKQETKFRLSERNCVEIVMKLIAKGHLQVYFTLDGREYVTPSKLESEIKHELQLRGGRLNVLDLAPLLNIDLRQITTKVEELVSRYRQLHFVQGDLISDAYLDKVAEEINESLCECSQVTLTELAERFALPQEFLAKAIRARLGTIIKGVTLEENVLYTRPFVLRYKARIRGLFTAITKPVSIPHLLEQHQFHKRLFDSILSELIREKRIAGELQGSYYIPHIFELSRRNFIDSFFKQNAYDTVSQLAYPNPKKFLQTTYADGVALKTCFLSRHIVENVDASIAEVLSTESWINIMSLLPMPLSRADAFVVLQECSEIREEKRTGPKPVILGECFVVSSALLDRMIQLLDDFYNTYVTNKTIQTSLPKLETSEQQTNTSEVNKNTNADQFSSNESHSNDKITEREEIREAEETSSHYERKSSGRRKKKNDSTQKGSVPKQPSTRLTTNKTNQTPEVSSKQPDEEEIKEQLKKWIPDYHDDDDENKEILSLIFDYLRPTLTELKKKAEQRVYLNIQSTEKKEKIKSLFEKFEVLSANIQLFKKGIQDVEGRHRNALDKYLLKTLCTDLVSVLMEIAAHDYHLLHQNSPSPSSSSSSSFSTENSQLLQQLPSELSKPLMRLIKTLETTTDDFLRELKNVADRLQMPLKPIDKKSIRNLLFGHRQESLKQLAEDTNPLTAFHLTVLILYIRVCGSMVYVPSRSASTLLAQLKGRLNEQIYKKLADFNDLLTKYLQTTSQSNEDADSKTNETVLLQQLQSALPELKALANLKDLGSSRPPEK